MIRALIFDFDGLILDTEWPIYQSWLECYRHAGGDLSFEKWGAIIGMHENVMDPFGDLEAQLGRSVDREALAPPRLQRERELIATQPLLPGVEDYLHTGKQLGLKIGLASSSSCDWVEGHLSRFNLLEYFDCILASNDVVHAKPAPDLFLAALECLQVAPGEAVVFEDSPNGIEAAVAAGIYAVAVPNELTRRLSLEKADLRLDSLAELPLAELLRWIESGL